MANHRLTITGPHVCVGKLLSAKMPKHETTRTKSLYLIVILTAIALIAANQAVIQYLLLQTKSDAAVINMAGRQRMLSLKINLQFLQAYKAAGADPDRLKQRFPEWRQTGHWLIAGNDQRNIAPCQDRQTVAKLRRALHMIDFIGARLNPKQLDSETMAAISRNQTAFLALMEEIVSDMETNANRRTRKIIVTAIVLSLVSLGVLLLEYGLIIRPNFDKIHNQKRDLAAENEKLRAIAWMHSHEIRRPLANIMGLVYLIETDLKENSTGPKTHEHEVLNNLIKSSRELDQVIQEIVFRADYTRQDEK